MAEHTNATRLRAGYDAFSTGDLEKLNEFIPEDAVWHVTGNGPLSGDYTSRNAIYGYFGKLTEMTAGTFKATLLHVLADDEYAMALQRSTATIDGKDVTTTDVLVSRVVDGKNVETWAYPENDQILGA